MSLLAAADRHRVGASPSRRVPIEFLEIELALLEEMGLQLRASPTSTSPTTATPGWSTSRRIPSTLHAPIDKIHPMPFPGLNIDNLPFFAVIARRAPRARR